MKETKYFYEYLNNENPFAFLNGYEKNAFLDKKIRKRLESIQKMQPTFVPCGFDPDILSKEHNNAMNVIIKNSINQYIHKGLQLLIKHNVDFDGAEFAQLGSGNVHHNSLDFSSVGVDIAKEEQSYNLLRLDNILWILKKHSSIEGMEDVIISIYKLKLLNKQNMIRNRVYNVIKDNIDNEVVSGMDFTDTGDENNRGKDNESSLRDV